MIAWVLTWIAVGTSALLWARTVRPKPRVVTHAATCRVCRYSLEGLATSGVCPECGAQEPWYRERRGRSEEALFDQWGLSAIVIGASALATVWPMLLHEIVHATAGWLNRRGHGPIFSPGPVPEMWAWVGVPLAALLTLGYATSEQPRLNRLRIGLAIAAVTWLILSVMTLGSWWANSGYEMLRSAGGIGAVWAGASGVLMVPIVLRDLAIRVFSPAGDRNMTAQRGEWLERSKAHSRSS